MSDTNCDPTAVPHEPPEKPINGEANAEHVKNFDVDPSTGRKVPHKKANEAYLVHQRWLEKKARIEKRKQYERENRPLPKELQGVEEPDFSPLANFLFSMVFAAFVSMVIFLLAGLFIQGDLLWGYRGKWTNWHRYVPKRPMVEFTPEELKKFDGSNPDLPVLLSISGSVFDVSKGVLYYGPGGPYHMFAGRDASRAYVTGCFETHLTHDVRGLSPEQVEALERWYKFYADHNTYYKVGSLKVPPLDPNTPIPEPCHEAVNQKP
ncbi:hypothetical protein MCAP1_001848 [Malassezia caprae]|uniref:Cytochrome b5 heme-binding domain-containing protein n=1 Tax=Malassezia caprae TaxID=1381934 RepID=A0AAF0IVB0_9BASI|nr:hypothetical protein MCAP1_001848 [Malassezia caprae]